MFLVKLKKKKKEFEPTPKNEAMTQTKPSLNSAFNYLDNNDLDLPIVLQKGKRQCIQYPLSHFVSYERLSPSHQAFLTHLNIVSVPKTLSEAFKNEEWRQAMIVETSHDSGDGGTWEE